MHDAAPAAEYEPGLQFVQLVESLPPVPPKYMPAIQAVQFEELLPPEFIRYVPVLQLVHDD